MKVVRSEADKASAEAAQRQVKAEQERLQRLQTLPATADHFRDRVAEFFWSLAGFTKQTMQPEDGYRFTDEAVEEFMDAVRDAYWALKEGDTTGRSPRQELKQALCANAQADAPLQRFLTSITSAASEE